MTICPRCGFAEEALGAPDSSATQQDIASVATVAEAGYLVSLFQSAGLTATTRPVESFSAVTGAWSSSHLISVAEADAAIARALMRAESRGEDLQAALEVEDAQHAEPSVTVNPWRMLAVLTVIVASGVVLSKKNIANEPRAGLAGEELERDQPGVEPEALLAVALRQAPAAFYSSADTGERRRLTFSEQAQEWTLSIDQDRDGRYEKHRRFRVTPPVAAAAIDR